MRGLSEGVGTMLQQERFEETSFSFSVKAPKPPERRRENRHISILRVGTLIVDGVRELCLVRNISAGGLMVHSYSTLEQGRRVAVELKADQPLTGVVIWVRESNVGIEFDEQIDVAEMLSNPAVLENGWRPRMPRVEVDRLATLRSGARIYWVNTRDISQGGVKIETDQPLPIGSEVVLSLEGFRPIQGTVRWQKDELCGIRFNQFAPFGELVEWLKRNG